MAGTRSCTWLRSAQSVRSGNGSHGAEEAPLLLLPCLDYGCSRCKCVSEPLTNTNAGIKGQQQQSSHTHARGRARTHAYKHAVPRSRVRTHARTHTPTLARTHTGTRSLRARTQSRCSPPRAADGQGAPELPGCNAKKKMYFEKINNKTKEAKGGLNKRSRPH